MPDRELEPEEVTQALYPNKAAYKEHEANRSAVGERMEEGQRREDWQRKNATNVQRSNSRKFEGEPLKGWESLAKRADENLTLIKNIPDARPESVAEAARNRNIMQNQFGKNIMSPQMEGAVPYQRSPMEA